MSSFATPSYPFQGRTGAESAQDGSYQPFRVDRGGALVINEAHGKYSEQVRLGKVFTLTVGPTTTGISAGNRVSASGAAACQLAILNPAGSGLNYAILKLGIAVVSGTFPAGPVVHGYSTGATLAASVTTDATPINNLLGSALTSSAITIGVAASTGSALTGGGAVKNGPIANFAATATAQAVPGLVAAVEDVNGVIVIPPGVAYIPLFTGAGTSVLSYMSVTWEEIPV